MLGKCLVLNKTFIHLLFSWIYRKKVEGGWKDCRTKKMSGNATILKMHSHYNHERLTTVVPLLVLYMNGP